jgi:phosphoglycolate phosphatase-like HAD superfamily hydrolase
MRDQMLIVTDVDNTLYDWVGLWAGAFGAMLRTLAEKSRRPAQQWTKELQAVHLRRNATECPSLLCDLAAGPAWPVGVDPATVLPPAAAAYRQYWDHHLTTYPGIREALGELSEHGHVVVAYTEGDVSIAASRIARLGLAGIIRRVFGRAPLPAAREAAWCTVGVMRNCPIAVDFIPREDSKPNPTGLRTIIGMCGASPQATVYVGDNLWKDVVMAQVLGVGAMWARYGTVRNPEHVALLEGVAHWSAQSVAAERSTTLHTVTPDAVLDAAHDLPMAIARRATTSCQLPVTSYQLPVVS